MTKPITQDGESVRKQELEDEFKRGWLLCLSTLANQHIRGTSSEAEELFHQIGSPSAAEVRRLGLTEFDRSNLNAIRKAARRG